MRTCFSAVLGATTALMLASGVASAQTFVGFWRVDQGPFFDPTPTAYSGRQAAALLFGGLPTDYVISTVDNTVANINNKAWYSTYGGTCDFVFPCGNAYDHDYLVSTGGRYESEGDVSAYVDDWAGGEEFTNYAFRVTGTVPEPGSVALVGIGISALAVRYRRRRNA